MNAKQIFLVALAVLIVMGGVTALRMFGVDLLAGIMEWPTMVKVLLGGFVAFCVIALGVKMYNDR